MILTSCYRRRNVTRFDLHAPDAKNVARSAITNLSDLVRGASVKQLFPARHLTQTLPRARTGQLMFWISMPPPNGTTMRMIDQLTKTHSTTLLLRLKHQYSTLLSSIVLPAYPQMTLLTGRPRTFQ